MAAGYACQIAFSNDMNFIMSGDSSGKLVIWDWKSKKIYKCVKKITPAPAPLHTHKRALGLSPSLGSARTPAFFATLLPGASALALQPPAACTQGRAVAPTRRPVTIVDTSRIHFVRKYTVLCVSAGKSRRTTMSSLVVSRILCTRRAATPPHTHTT